LKVSQFSIKKLEPAQQDRCLKHINAAILTHLGVEVAAALPMPRNPPHQPYPLRVIG
jgi:hypothetical protein